jgi:hypothetical protein
MIGAGALAIAGVAAGAIGGILTLDARATAEQACAGRTCVAGSPGDQALKDAQGYATISTAGWITAGVAVAAGAGVWLLSSRRGGVAPAAALGGPGGAQVAF